MEGIKRIYEEQAQKEAQKQSQRSKPLTDEDVRRILRDEFINVSGLSKNDGFSFRNNRNL